ncbi:AAA family ATPase [Paenarthrobacter nitroguajacolicus]
MTEPWVDAPETDRRKDKLDRGPFVDMAKDLIENLADSNDSTVFGLVGPWGSGKTSVLNFITSALDRSVHVVKFNPWSFDEERLQAELYSAILEAFPRGSRKTLRKKAVDLARRSAPALKAIPVIGTGASETVREFLPAKSWDSAFQDMAETIKAASVKVLVVVDDVDRVQPKDLLLLMKTIRLLGRFPRVNYILAYDRKSTITALAAGLGNDPIAAQVYLEKIVQYPLDLPEPQQHFLQEIIESALGPTVRKASLGTYRGPTPESRFETFYTEHMTTTLTTPRACHRYAGQAITFLQLAKGNVDPADFFAITFLRIFYPDLYERLPAWAGDLTRKQGSNRSSKAPSEDEWLQRIKSCGYKGDTVVELMEALSSLFPHAFPDNMWRTAGGKYRANDSEYFDRYFTISLPTGDMSDEAVLRDINRIRTAEVRPGGVCPETFDHANEQMQIKALKKGARHTDYDTNARPLIDYLSIAIAKRPSTQDFRDTATRLQESWLARLLSHSDPWDEPELKAFIGLFPRPESLGHCLNLNNSHSARAMAELEAMGAATTVADQTLTDQLIPLWIDQATQWLVDAWRTRGSADSIHEQFAVWNYLVAMDGLPHLQAVTLDALKDGSLAMTTLADAFVMASTEAGNYEAAASQLTLFTDKLENTITPEKLMELPLDKPAKVAEAQGDEIPSPAQRKRFAYEEILRWRAKRANPLADGDGTPPA